MYTNMLRNIYIILILKFKRINKVHWIYSKHTLALQDKTHHNSTRHHRKQTTPITQNINLRQKIKKHFNRKRRMKECLSGFTKKAKENERSMILMIIYLAWQTKFFHVKSPRSFCNFFLWQHQKRFSPVGSFVTLHHVQFSQDLGFSFSFGLGFRV